MEKKTTNNEIEREKSPTVHSMYSTNYRARKTDSIYLENAHIRLQSRCKGVGVAAEGAKCWLLRPGVSGSSASGMVSAFHLLDEPSLGRSSPLFNALSKAGWRR